MRILSLFLSIFAFASSLSAKIDPLEIYEERSISEKKPLLIFFLGSGWCHWCDEMKKHILTKRDFLRNVEKDFILVEVDFPRGAGRNKNEQEFKKRFGVGRYPTVVIWDPKSEKFFKESGYRDLTPQEYAIRLKEKFFETSFESGIVGVGGYWGNTSQESIESKAEAPKGSKKISQRKESPKTRQPSRSTRGDSKDQFDVGAVKPDYEWIGTENSEQNEIKAKETIVAKNEDVKWQRYAKKIARSRSSKKALKTMIEPIIRIGNGGTWWIFKTR
jgi:thioredoxin-related protein